MKITKVTFDCTIGMPGYNNVKPGVAEVILEDGDTLEGAWSELNRRAKEWHKKEYPHLYEGEQAITDYLLSAHGATKEPVVRSKQPEDQRISALIADIYSSGDLKILESYRILSKSAPELQAAYQQRKEQLEKESNTSQ